MLTTAARKLRAACDVCHNAKMKCSGGLPCSGCASSGCACYYSYSNRLGRPRGAKNKTTSRNPVDLTPESGDYISIPPSDSWMNIDNLKYNEPVNGDGPLDVPWDLSNQSVLDLSKELGLSGDTNWDVSPTSTARYQTSPDFTTPRLPSQNTDQISRSPSFTRTSSSINTSSQLSPQIANEHSVHQQRTRQTDAADASSRAKPTQERNCNCISRNANFFSGLKKADQSQKSLSISATLEAAKHILNLCEALLSCNSCMEDDDDAARLLLVLSIRTVLKRLKTSLVNTGGSSISSQGGGDKQSGVYMSKRLSSRGKGEKGDTTGTVKVGNLELSGDDQAYVVKMLVVRSVDKIKNALQSLKETGRYPGGSTEKDHSYETLASGGHGNEPNMWNSGEDWRSAPGVDTTGYDCRFLSTVVESLGEYLRELQWTLENVSEENGDDDGFV